MTFSSTLILAFGMSMDAFAVSIGKGATLHKPPLREALRTGFIFGIIEAITPLIGWSLGLMASRYIMAWDHWVAFTLLACLGMRMMIGGFRRPQDDAPSAGHHSLRVLVLTGIATSLDALAIGVGLAFLQVNILHTAMIIGLATMLMVTLGILLGRFIGPWLGKKAEIIGGIILIGIGCNILYVHLFQATQLPGL